MKSYIYTSWYLQTYCLSILTNMTTNEVLHLHLLISTNTMSVNLNEYDDKWSLTFTPLDIYKQMSVNLNEYGGKWSLTSYIYSSWYLQTYCLSILTNKTTNEVLHLHLLISTNIMSVNLNEYDDKWSLTFTILDIYKHIVCQSLRIWGQMKSYIYSSWYLQTYCLSILTNMTTNEVLHLHFLISTYIFCQS